MAGGDWREEVVRGPLAYNNWRTGIELNVPAERAWEYPLFTDAFLYTVASLHPWYQPILTRRYGPYEIVSTQQRSLAGGWRPSLILRIEEHGYYTAPYQDEKTDAVAYHGGREQDEVAALLALLLGVRLKAGWPTRRFQMGTDPRGLPITPGVPDPTVPETSPLGPILPRLLGQHAFEDTQLLLKLPDLSPEDAVALVRAARLYQEAVWVAEITPELSWLMLVSAVETAAHRWRSEQAPIEKLRDFDAKLFDALTQRCGEDLVLRLAKKIAGSFGATREFREFILNFLPGPPPEHRATSHRHPWTDESMRKHMSKIYHYRSQTLHGGTPFPAPLCQPPTVGQDETITEVPDEEGRRVLGAVWSADDAPMLLQTFEYIVRGALTKWWASL